MLYYVTPPHINTSVPFSSPPFLLEKDLKVKQKEMSKVG